MSRAIVLVNSDTSYLEHKLSELNYTTYAIDEFNHRNIQKLQDLDFIKSFINNVLSNHGSSYLVYGSGLENKKSIYDLLMKKLVVKGNNLNILTKIYNLGSLKNILEAHNLKIPEDFEQDRSVENKFIWKPLYGSGGYGISLKAKSELSHYKQKYLPGKTFSISFICNKDGFKFLGFNNLLLLKSFPDHPFVHAGAITIKLNETLQKTISAFKGLALDLSLRGYNNIDFKIIKNDVYILDINPRITSTFKIYNDINDNRLLRLHINEDDVSLSQLSCIKQTSYGFVHLFAKEDFFFKKYLNENWITNIPKEGEHINAGDPIFSIYLSAPSESELISKLRENISKLGDYYSFYDIVI